MEAKLISQGAEAKIYVTESDDGKAVAVKERVSKSYRHRDLDDKIRKFRTKREVKVLKKLGAEGINVPYVAFANRFDFGMQMIEGMKIRDFIDQSNTDTVARLLAEQISRMHDLGVIHGDLTTSNMIMSDSDGKRSLFLIDFGLSFFSDSIEDKAVDLHLLKQALISKHHKVADELIEKFFGHYHAQQKKEITKKLISVEMRGRHKNK